MLLLLLFLNKSHNSVDGGEGMLLRLNYKFLLSVLLR